MTDPSPCSHDGPRERGAVPLVCGACGGIEVARAPHSRCARCGGDGRRGPGWETNGPEWSKAVSPHLASIGHQFRATPYLVGPSDEELRAAENERIRHAREAVAERERRAREEAERKAEREAGARRVALAAEATRRAREAEEQRRRQEAERRRAEIDRALLSGEETRGVLYAVRGATEAQVRARQLDLARVKEHRGKPWAELALDREIARLLSLGTKRDAIRDQLGVGEHRIARVRRRHRTGTGSAP